MTIAIRYYSKTGNTKKIAQAISDEIGIEAKEISVPLDENVDILFLGSAIYAAGIDKSVKAFLEENKSKIGTIYNFSTAALLQSTYKHIKKLSNKLGIHISNNEFHCRGRFKFAHKEHPNNGDLQNAKMFAKNIVNKE